MVELAGCVKRSGPHEWTCSNVDQVVLPVILVDISVYFAPYLVGEAQETRELDGLVTYFLDRVFDGGAMDHFGKFVGIVNEIMRDVTYPKMLETD